MPLRVTKSTPEAEDLLSALAEFEASPDGIKTLTSKVRARDTTDVTVTSELTMTVVRPAASIAQDFQSPPEKVRGSSAGAVSPFISMIT